METIVNGLLIGGLYTTIALGLSLVFGVMRLVNLAHGELLVGGAYVAFFVVSHGHVDPLLSLVVAVPVIFAIAYPLQRFVLEGLLIRGIEPALVATFGISIVVQSLLTEAYSGNARSFTTGYADDGFSVAGIDVRVIYMIAFAIALALVAATELGLRRTRFGTALRAAAQDADTARTMGVNVAHVHGVTFGVAAAMAAIGGVLVGLAYSFTPTTGQGYLLRGFCVVVLGGVGSVWGTLAGGLALGLAESVAADQLGGAYRDLAVYLLFIAVLALRPGGLFNRRVAW
ncbi:MAG: branched-chain amino acid ABC transporter permease [Solirubrobacterales bacterium]